MTTPLILLTGYGRNSVTADWRTEKARFHVWINRDGNGQWIIEETIYKNPPVSADGKPRKSTEPGYFETRTLDLTAKAHAAAFARIKELATHDECERLALASVAERDAKIEAENRAARVASLARSIALIRNASGDDLAAASLDLPPDIAAAVERLRTV